MANWFTNPASNTMLDNSFRNQFFQNQVRPVQTGASNVRPTNLQALRNWTPWKSMMPQRWGGTFHTGPTAGASSALGYGAAAALPLGVAGLTHMVQKGLPEELKGKGGLFNTSTAAWGGMGASAGIDPEVDEILRANAIFSGNKNVPMEEQVTETETLDPYTGLNMRDISGEVGEYGDKPGEGFNEEMFYQKPGMWDKVKSMFQTNPAHAGNLKYAVDDAGFGTGSQRDQFGMLVGQSFADPSRTYDDRLQERKEELDKFFAAGKKNSTFKKQQEYINNLLKVKEQEKIAADTAAKAAATTIRPSHYGEQGGGGYRDAPIHSAAAAAAQGIDVGATGMMGPGGVHYAYGGRVGYNQGGRVGILAAF